VITASDSSIQRPEPLGGRGLEVKKDIASMLGSQPSNNLLAAHALGEHPQVRADYQRILSSKR
jgi:hypothetical protein